MLRNKAKDLIFDYLLAINGCEGAKDMVFKFTYELMYKEIKSFIKLQPVISKDKDYYLTKLIVKGFVLAYNDAIQKFISDIDKDFLYYDNLQESWDMNFTVIINKINEETN